MSEQLLCDLCGQLGVDWEWETPNTVTLEQALAGQGRYFEDPVWLICNECHELVLAGARDQVRMRAVMNLPKVAEAAFADPFLAQEINRAQRATLEDMHAAFWKGKTEYRPYKSDKG